MWADVEFAGTRYRWTVHAVLQAMAFHAAVAGEQRSGTWLVGAGGRALSLATGLLSEDTVWRVLGDLRDRPGAPLVLVRHHIGVDADVYALTSQNRVINDPSEADRMRIEPVHDAWYVLGHHLRRIYELIAHHGLTRKADIYAAARVPRGSGDTTIVDLEVAGLITRTGWGTVGVANGTLDEIERRHRLEDSRAARIERYGEERAAWRAWLVERERQRSAAPVDDQLTEEDAFVATTAELDAEYVAWLDSVMATGPPSDDEEWELHAIDMVAELLGARIVVGA
jgi:hypothetical protein